MLFKTFDSDIDNLMSKIGVFNKSFWAMKQDLKHGNGLAYSLFGGQNVTPKDKQAILDLNTHLKNGVNPGKAWASTMSNCSIAAQNQTRQCLDAEESLTKLANGLKITTVKAKAAAVGLNILKTAGNMMLFATISKGIDIAARAIDKYIHAAEIAREKSSELTDSWVSENSSINESISKYKELKNKINDASISSSEIKSIKEDLLEVQNNLVDKYGQEALGIDLVNGKYDEQIAKLDKLSKQKAQEYVAENYSNIQDDKKYLTEKINLKKSLGFTGTISNPDDYSNAGFELGKYLEKYDKLDTKITPKGEYSIHGDVHLITNGTREEVYKQLTQLFNDLSNDFGESNKDVNTFKNTLSGIIQDSFDTEQIEESKNNVKKYAEAEILSNNNTRKLYEEATLAVDEYNDALSSGVGVEEAKKKLDEVKTNVIFNTSNISGSKSVFDDIYGNINHTAEKTYEITSKLNNDVSVKKYAEQLKGLTDDDLKQINFSDSVQSPGEEAFGALINILGLSEDEVQNLIDKLVELGYIQEELQDSPLNEPPTSTPQTFSEAWSSIGTSDDEQTNNTALEAKEKLLELAETGKLTEKELSKSPLADYFKNAGVSIEEATIKINRMKSYASQMASLETGISSISSILGEKETNLSSEETKEIGISAETLNAMPDDVKAQTREYDNFVKVLGDGSSSMDKCRAAANKLATAYVNSNNFLANLTREEKDYYISLLKKMGIENAAAVVTNALNRQKITSAMESFNLENATEGEITKLGQYVSALDDSGNSLAYYTLQQQIANNNALDTSDSIKNLKSLAEQCGVSGEAIILLNSLEKDTAKLEKYTTGDKKNNANADTIISKTESRIAKTKKNINKLFKKGSQTQTEIDNSKPSNSSAPTDTGKTKQQFDWIETRLNNISKLAGAAQKAISRMLSIKGIKIENEK